MGDLGSTPGLGRSPGEGNGNPLQYSCLENPMDGGAWWAAVHQEGRKELDPIEQLQFHFTFISWRLITLQYCSIFILFYDFPLVY